MQLTSEFKEFLLKQNVDVDNKTIYIDEEITHATFLKVAKAIQLIGSEVPQVLVINSEGGSYYDAMAIADLVKRFKVTTVGVGKVLSSALIILVSGAQKYAYPETWLMYHSSSYEQEGAHKELKASVEQAEREEIQSAQFMSSNTKKSRKFWKKIADTGDYYFTAKEAIKLGVINGIIGN